QEIVDKGTRWKIGTGENIKVWSHSWLRDNESSKMSTSMIMGFEDLTVAELMIPGFLQWDEEHIILMFNERDTAIILRMSLSRGGSEDRPIWHYGKTGGYTVRSAYRLCIERVVTRMHLPFDGGWNELWKM
ncbi:hypothetical protein LINPERHAP2_LOCUS28748, partial [Linum perenne]